MDFEEICNADVLSLEVEKLLQMTLEWIPEEENATVDKDILLMQLSHIYEVAKMLRLAILAE